MGLRMDQNDVWRAATTLIRRHGFARAADVAGLRANDLRDTSDTDGADVWRRIEDVIWTLEQSGYQADATKH